MTILCSGCFDGLHAGHIRYLTAARRIDPAADLIVAVANDLYIESVKGHSPKWPLADRMRAVLGVKGVSSVVEHTAEGACSAIRQLKPDYFVKGADWVGTLPQGDRDACREVQAQIVFTPEYGKHGRDV